MPVLIDFESRSRADLKRVGGRRYWEHPSSEVLCCVWCDSRTSEVGLWLPGRRWPHEGRVLAAHNAAGFDRFAAERCGFGAAGWIDTSQLARKAGLPGALDALGLAWCGVAKDAEGSKFTKALSSVRRPSKGDARIEAAAWKLLDEQQKRERGVMPGVDAAVLDRVIAYCASDVAILAEAWPQLAAWVNTDAEVEALDSVINDRGVLFDVALAGRLLAEDARNGGVAVAACAAQCAATPAEIRAAAKSPTQFCKITGCENAQAEIVEACTHPLARVREALASIASGKLAAGLARVHADGRLRDNLLYYGGHTGRFSGRGMQLHNLPRPAKVFEDLPVDTAVPHTVKEGKRVVDVDRFAEAVLAGAHCDADGVALLVRATLCAPQGCAFAVCDFSSVEARATAWAAGDEDAVDVFVSGRDPYKVAAAATFDVAYEAVTKSQRGVGKVQELALGYGGGPNALTKMAHQYRVDLSALNLREVVDTWRELHSPIRDLWYGCERAFRCAINGDDTWAGPFEYVASDNRDAVACYLPSGRPIVYNKARVDGTSRGGIVYKGTADDRAQAFCPKCCTPLPPKSKNCAKHGEVSPELWVRTYGGKLVENAIQAMCRDLMTSAMLRAEAAGLRVVLHVHDELVCEVPEAGAEDAYKLLHACMTALPPWAEGFPIGADGYVAKRYRK